MRGDPLTGQPPISVTRAGYLTGLLMTLLNPMTLAFWFIAVPGRVALFKEDGAAQPADDLRRRVYRNTRVGHLLRRLARLGRAISAELVDGGRGWNWRRGSAGIRACRGMEAGCAFPRRLAKSGRLSL